MVFKSSIFTPKAIIFLMVRIKKFVIHKDKLEFKDFLWSNLPVLLKINSSVSVGDDILLFIPSIFVKKENTVFNIRHRINKDEINIIGNTVIWDNESSIVNILNYHLYLFITTYNDVLDEDERDDYQLDINTWIPIKLKDQRKYKIKTTFNVQ